MKPREVNVVCQLDVPCTWPGLYTVRLSCVVVGLLYDYSCLSLVCLSLVHACQIVQSCLQMSCSVWQCCNTSVVVSWVQAAVTSCIVWTAQVSTRCPVCEGGTTLNWGGKEAGLCPLASFAHFTNCCVDCAFANSKHQAQHWRCAASNIVLLHIGKQCCHEEGTVMHAVLVNSS